MKKIISLAIALTLPFALIVTAEAQGKMAKSKMAPKAASKMSSKMMSKKSTKKAMSKMSPKPMAKKPGKKA